MRRRLLAGAVALGAAIASITAASAQQALPPDPAQPLGLGLRYQPSRPLPYLGGNNQLNAEPRYMLSTREIAPPPGTVVIHLHGRVNWYTYLQGGSANQVGVNKLAPHGFIGYARYFPGVDGQATNGLRYGAITEIRQNFTAATGSPAGSGASAQSAGSTLFMRRAAVYFGTPTIGIFRLGVNDGPISQFDGGVTTFTAFNDGVWSIDLIGAFPQSVLPTFPFWSNIGNENAIAKAVYLSPQFYGFDFGLAYAPSNATGVAGVGCVAAGTGCITLSSSSVATDSWRFKDMYQVFSRYRGSIGDVAIYALAGYVGSGRVKNGAGASLGENLSIGDAGLALTYAGVTIGGHVLAGQTNGMVGLKPAGGVDAVGWLAGIQYVRGPVAVGAAYFNYQSQGAPQLVGISQRNENGLAVAGTYNLLPGLKAYVAYLYGDRHQGGFNFIANAPGPANNNVHGQALMIGTRVVW